MNYTKLMSQNPTKYGSMTNDKGQVIDFYECPLNGDDFSIIAVNHDLQLAEYTGVFDLDDMTAEHGEYQPSFVLGQLYIGEFEV